MEYTSLVEKKVIEQPKTEGMFDCLYTQSDYIMYYADQDTFESIKMNCYYSGMEVINWTDQIM